MQRRDLGGLPLFFEEGPEPAMASLVFRVGVCDEEPTQRGITHVVEHLALFSLGTREHPYNGFVDLLNCTFFAHGTQDELEAFLSDVCKAIGNLPLDRLDAEKRVLQQEAVADPGDIVSELMAHRFGSRAFGAANVQELGLRWLEPEPIAKWASERFTRQNAALWFHGPEPPGELPLGQGERIAPPPPEPLEGLDFPAWVADGTGGVAVGALIGREWASTVWLGLARERLFERLRLNDGLVYEVWADYAPLGRDTSHVALGTACPDEDAGRVTDTLLTALEELRDAGPSDEELATLKRRIERSYREDPEVARRDLDVAARNALLGRESEDTDEELALLQLVTPEEVRGISATALSNAVVRVPRDTPAPRDNLAPLDRPPAEIDAPRFKHKALLQGPTELSIGEAGIRWARDGEVVAIPADEVAAVIEGSADEFVVVAIDGSWIEVKPDALRDGDAAAEAIRRLSPAPLIPSDDKRPGRVKQLADEKLKRRWVVETELSLLPEVLQQDEQPLTMAEASRGMRAGLLVVTDRRLLFLFSGLRKEEFLQFRRPDVSEVRIKRKFLEKALWVRVEEDEFEFTDIKPKEREREIVAELGSA
jgi:zinc protease